MQFQIPQFIEQEDKIFGPLTWKQFLYVSGGAGAIFVLWSLLPRFFAVILIIPVATLSAMLAFKPINNRPFELTLEAAVRFVLKEKLYLWKKTVQKPMEKDIKETVTTVSSPADLLKDSEKKTSSGHLDDLSWQLEVGNQKPKDNG